MTAIEHDERFQRAVDAVQEEFDERGLGAADLIVQVILDASGYPTALRAALAAPDDRPLLTTRQVGERLGISERTARDLLYERDGKPPRLPSVVIGDGARRVVPADLDAYVESQRC